MRLCAHEKIIREHLVKARIDNPGLCARMLLCFICNLDSGRYLLYEDQELKPELVFPLYELVRRRACGEPMAYILGKKSFYLHEFDVNRHTLIPRPETELLVELPLRILPERQLVFVDIGCGCGCIGLSLLAQRPRWRGILLDKSQTALCISKINAQKIAPGAQLLSGDIFSLPFKAGSMDAIISNPPYISWAEIKEVMPEVLAYEPPEALFSEMDGHAHLKTLIENSWKILKPQGWIFLEHGYKQNGAVCDFLQKAGFKNIQSHKDLASLPRCVSAQKG